MHSCLKPEYGLWLEPVLALAVGAALIVGLAACAARLVETAAWKRTIWQVGTLGLLVLLLVEMTGLAPALADLLRAKARRASTETSSAPAGLRQPAPARAAAPDATAAAPGSARGAVARFGVERFAIETGELAERPEFPPELATIERTSVKTRETTAVETPKRTSVETPWIAAGAPDAPRLEAIDFGTNALADRLAARAGDTPGDSPESRLGDVARLSTALPVETTLGPASEVATVTPLDSGPAWWPAAIWLLGAVVMIVRIAWSRVLLLLFRRRHPTVADRRLCRRVSALAHRLGLRRPVVVLEAAGLTTPVAFGRFRPTLALPSRFSHDFDPPRQEAMLAHELAHLAACDPVWQLVADLACALLWWHPLVWWSRRRLRSASEAAADEASLLIPDGPDLLAACLVALGRRLTRMPPQRLGWLSVEGSGFRSNLGCRVDRLLSLPGRSWRAPGRRRLLVARTALPAALVIVTVFSTVWVRPQAAYAEGGTTMSVVERSWRRSLAAAALVAFLSPISGDAVSQERDVERERPIAIERDRPAENPSAERQEREAREGEAREREAREGERGERREVDRPDRPEAEGPERRALAHQLEVLQTALLALRERERGDAVELLERAIRARQVTLEGRRDDEAHMIRERAPNRAQLAEILTAAAGLWRELGDQEKAAVVGRLAQELARGEREPERDAERPARERERREGEERERREVGERERREVGERERREAPDRERPREVERPDRPRAEGERPARELMEKRGALVEKAAQIRRQLAGLRDDQDADARELQAALQRIEAQLRELRPEARRPVPEERLQVFRRLEELKEALGRAESEEEEVRIQRQIAEIMEEVKRRPVARPDVEVPREERRPVAVPPAVRREMEELEGVVRELRQQVQQMREEMEEMRRLLRRVVEREEGEEGAREREEEEEHEEGARERD